MRGATSPRLLLELMCARVLLPAAEQGEAALLARLERLERGGVVAAAVPLPGSSAPPVVRTAAAAEAQPVQQPQPEVRTPAARPPADDWPAPTRPGASQAPSRQPDGALAAPPVLVSPAGGAFHQTWPQVLDVLKRRSPAVWANVNTNSQLIGVEGNIVTLGFSQVGAMRNFVNGAKDTVVAAAITEVLGGTWRVEAVVGNSPGGAPSSASPAPAQAVRQAPAARPEPPRPDSPPAAEPAPQRGPSGSQGAPSSKGAPSPGRRQATAEKPQAAPPASDEPWPDAPPLDDEGQAPSSGSGLAAARSAAHAAAQAGPRQAVSAAWPDAVPRRSGSSATEADEVDPDNDADADADSLTGMALVQRELGGQIVGEIDHT
jgi:DNA polymerase-3 subunit gamma/tau